MYKNLTIVSNLEVPTFCSFPQNRVASPPTIWKSNLASAVSLSWFLFHHPPQWSYCNLQFNTIRTGKGIEGREKKSNNGIKFGSQGSQHPCIQVIRVSKVSPTAFGSNIGLIYGATAINIKTWKPILRRSRLKTRYNTMLKAWGNLYYFHSSLFNIPTRHFNALF